MFFLSCFGKFKFKIKYGVNKQVLGQGRSLGGENIVEVAKIRNFVSFFVFRGNVVSVQHPASSLGADKS